MAQDVAQLIQAWIDDENVRWEASPDVVDWARAYGTDLERAWSECPRADFSMAIAGACRAEPELVVRVARAVAREALALVPAEHALPRKAVHLAESIRAGSREIPEAAPLLERTMAFVRDLATEAERLQKAARADARRAIEVLAETGTRFLLDPSTRERLAGAESAATVGELPAAAVASTLAMLEGILAEKAVVKYRDRLARARRAVAAAHAARAAASSLSVAASHDTEVRSLLLIESMVRHGTATDEALLDLDGVAGIARRARPRVYSEAALVFDHAAGAFGDVAAASEEAWVRAIAATVTGMFYAAGGAPLDEDSRGALHATLAQHAERAKAAKLAELADRIRAAVPFAALHPPEADADRDAAARRDPRGTLLRSLTSLAPLLRFMGAAGAAEAAETALAILGATGPLDRKALAPALRTLHERMAEAHRAHADDAGAAEEEARAAAAHAEEAMREMDEVLATLGADEPN